MILRPRTPFQMHTEPRIKQHIDKEIDINDMTEEKTTWP